jgi:hypothetical protein
LDSSPATKLQGNQPQPAATQDALSRPIDSTSDTSLDAPGSIPPPPADVVADRASLAAKLFRVGGKRMSGEDILRTIEVIEEMESVVISSLERQLVPAPHDQSYMNWIFDPLTNKEVPGPNDEPRTVKVRSRQDHSNAVKARFLSNEEKTQLNELTQKLPTITQPSTSHKSRSQFHSDMSWLLCTEQVPLHEVRRLLPIKESGSLTPVAAGATTKPAPEFTRTTSTQLREKARKLGLIDDE